MIEDVARERFARDGFVVLPAYLGDDELLPALQGLDRLFPSAAGFHDRTDERWRRFVEDEFDGIDTFPFTSVEVSLLALNGRLVDLAARLLGTRELRLYSAEAWAKYTGATEYEQWLHRDYLNHTTLVPSDDPAFGQVELFVWLVDVPDDLGAPRMVSRRRTAGLPARPNWLPSRDDEGDADGWVAGDGHPELYEAEVSGGGPAGTVVAFGPSTFHRGTSMTVPRGARYSLHLSLRPASVEWATRQGWADRSHSRAWYELVARATPEQLGLLGFPPPGHPFWTPQTLAGMAERYPGLDLAPWRVPLPGSTGRL